MPVSFAPNPALYFGAQKASTTGKTAKSTAAKPMLQVTPQRWQRVLAEHLDKLPQGAVGSIAWSSPWPGQLAPLSKDRFVAILDDIKPAVFVLLDREGNLRAATTEMQGPVKPEKIYDYLNELFRSLLLTGKRYPDNVRFIPGGGEYYTNSWLEMFGAKTVNELP